MFLHIILCFSIITFHVDTIYFHVFTYNFMLDHNYFPCSNNMYSCFLRIIYCCIIITLHVETIYFNAFLCNLMFEHIRRFTNNTLISFEINSLESGGTSLQLGNQLFEFFYKAVLYSFLTMPFCAGK